jgi:hypothetical protein
MMILCLYFKARIGNNNAPWSSADTKPYTGGVSAVITSRCHNTSSRLLVVLSCLASSLSQAPLRISSHPLCAVGCCIVALRLVLASPHTSHRDLPLCGSLLSHCISSSHPVVYIFCHRVWFSWLSRSLPSASCRTTSRRR